MRMRQLRDCFAVMDVAGYNYGIKRYIHDIKKYPDRVIVGSETFCSDAYKFFEAAKTAPALIGDFVWAGIDYLGELGLGAQEYREYAPDFRHTEDWISAGSGRLDLIGTPLGEALYTRVAFELTDKPQIAVEPVSHTGEKHSPSAWRFTNAIPSWSWNGLNGKKAHIEVYSRAPIVELYVNGKKAGRKKFKKNCKFDFYVKYYDGEITAVNLDENNNELSRNSLKTAGNDTALCAEVEPITLDDGLRFIKISYTDGNGNVKSLEHKTVTVSTENCELLALGNGCPVNKCGYCSNTTFTYYGVAMAVVKINGGKGVFTVTDGNLSASVNL